MHLRLVAGTEVSELRQEQSKSSEATRDVLDTAAISQVRESARILICALRPGLDDMSVSELLAEINYGFEHGAPSIALTQRNGDIRDALRGIGIHVHTALPEDGLDVHVYGLVIEPKKLLEVSPELMPFRSVLEAERFTL